MNVIYRLVWNITTNSWVVASELAKGRKKKTSTLRALTTALTLSLATTGAWAAAATVGTADTAHVPVIADSTDATTDAANNEEPVDITNTASSRLTTTGGASFAYLANDTYALSPAQLRAVPTYIAVDGAGLINNDTLNASIDGGDPSLDSAIAIGVASSAIGSETVAVGLNAEATANNAVAIGSLVAASGTQAVAFGSSALASGTQAVALGSSAQATSDYAVSLGNSGTVAAGNSSIAIGKTASTVSGASNSIAIGASAKVAAGATNGIALGAGAQASTSGGVAIGQGSIANRGTAVSVGSTGSQRQIINVAKGTMDTDVVNVSQLKGITTALGGGANVDTDGSIIQPSYTVGGTAYTNVGDALTAAASTVAPDANAVHYDDSSKALVTMAGTVSTDGGVTGGSKITNVAKATLDETSTDAVNGAQLYQTNLDVTANTTAITNLGNQISNGTIGLVQQAAAGANLTVGKDTDGAAVDFADKNGGTRTLANVTAGVNDTNAVNVSQIKPMISGLGGGATIDAITGEVTGPTYNVDGSDVDNVGDALTNIDGRVANNTTAITNLGNQISNGTIGLVQQAAAGANLTVGKDTDGAAVDFADKNGGTRTLTNVTAGVNDTNAVNVSQIKPMISGLGGGATIDAITGEVTGPTYNVDGSDVDNVGDALTNIDGRVANNATAITNLGNQINNGSIGLVQQAAAGANLTVGKDTDGAAVDFADKNGATRTLANITAGVNDADAVNVSQLKSSGLIDESGDALAALTYDKHADGTPNLSSVTMGGPASTDGGVTGGTKITNVAQATLDETSSDAVNGAQLYQTNENVAANTTAITNLGNQISNGTIGLVQQAAAGANLTVGKDTDGAAVDFADKNGGTRTLANVTAGVNDTNAVNVSQIKPMIAGLGGGATVDAITGEVTGPTYNVDGSDVDNVGDALTNIDGRVANNATAITNLGNQINNGSIGLVQQAAAGANLTVGKDTDGAAVDFADKNGGTRTLANITAGVNDADAVNVSQLKSSGLIDESGDALAALTYDKHADGTPNLSSVTMGGPASTDGGVTGGTKITNVAQATLDETSSDAVNGAQLYQTNENVAANATAITNLGNQISSGTIGLVQQAAAGANLTVGKDTDGVAVDFADKDGGTRTLANVTAGVNDTDAVNVSQLKSSGLIDESGNALAAVTYDTHADGTPDFGSVTMGGSQAVGPVTLKNVAAGVDDTDAVNMSQLKGTGLVGLDGGLQEAVTYDAGSNRGVVTFAGIEGSRLTNVMAGVVAPGSMDAVNGGQLWNVQDQLTSLGYRVTALENNSVPGTPSGPVVNGHFATEGDVVSVAVATGSSSVAAGENAQATGVNSTAVGSNSVASGSSSVSLGSEAQATASNAVALGNGSVADRGNSVSVGSTGSERQITHVAAGTATTDAANVGQVNAARDWAQNYTDQRVNGLSSRIDKVGRKASAGTAAAMAMTNIPQAYAPNLNALGAGIGTFNGQTAIAVGLSTISESGRWIFRISGTANSQGDSGAGIGAAMTW
ncbi:YadA-like family protein [Dyella sp. 20L07]|uniref:YadA-like family protein n=1 Tax=Dyella sp. 20L07 TaxID=3384240 RepID=UPI003D2BF001